MLDGPGRIRHGGKTPNSVREVPLTGRALAALDELPLRIDTTLVFPAPERQPLNLDNFRKREWVPAVEAAGIALTDAPVRREGRRKGGRSRVGTCRLRPAGQTRERLHYPV